MRQFLLISSVILALVGIACGGNKVDPPEDPNTNNVVNGIVCKDFSQSEVRFDPVDLFFIIDNSFSMLAEQERLAASATAFVLALESIAMQADIDIHIGVTTMDIHIIDPATGEPLETNGLNGALHFDTYVTQDTPDLAGSLRRLMIVGENGSTYETGLEAARLGIDPNGPNVVTNAGFIRDDALLQMIFITDEDDIMVRTPVPEYQKDAELFAIDYDNIKGPGNWKAHFVGHTDREEDDPLPVHPATTNGCFETEADDRGRAYYTVARLVNGKEESICNFNGGDPNDPDDMDGPDYTNFLTEILIESFTPIEFFQLDPEAQVVAGTIVITVNGSTVDPSEYNFNSDNVSVEANAGSILVAPEATDIEICYQDARLLEQ